jgi:hypothetical protein
MQVPFSWPDYLKEVKAQAAPASCFKQCPVPPENEFTIGTFILHLNNLNTPSAPLVTLYPPSPPPHPLIRYFQKESGRVEKYDTEYYFCKHRKNSDT